MSGIDDVPEDIKRAVRLGAEAEHFAQSPIGIYLQQRAQELTFKGLDALRTVDPEDAKAVRAAQNKVVIGESFMAFIKDAIDEGRNAEQTFLSRESTD